MVDVAPNRPRPPSVVAYGPAQVIWHLFFVLVSQEGFDGFLGGLLISLAVAFGLWRGSRAAWIIGIVLDGFAIILGIGHIVQEQTTLGAIQIVGGLVALGLLLAPPTRRWVS